MIKALIFEYVWVRALMNEYVLFFILLKIVCFFVCTLLMDHKQHIFAILQFQRTSFFDSIVLSSLVLEREICKNLWHYNNIQRKRKTEIKTGVEGKDDHEDSVGGFLMK